ncbi:MAG: CPBP family intramembrane glutamic endopeptidase [Phycisphaerales bacterium]
MSQGLEQQTSPATAVDLIPVALGVALFAWWLLSTSLGRKALAGSKPRRNSMIFLLPFLVFFLWLLSTYTLGAFAGLLAAGLDDWKAAFLGNLLSTCGSLATIVFVLIVAKVSFARGLKGFGLRWRTIPKDLAHAFLTLAAVWPLVMAMLSLTILVMKHFNQSFQLPQHEALEVITESGSVALQILMVVLAVLVAPLVEELMFRGMFQSMIRSYLDRPWPAIAITSILFAAIHTNSEHWPALFILAMGLGYSYEKSGSLLRPIFMHAMFNGVTIVAALVDSRMA